MGLVGVARARMGRRYRGDRSFHVVRQRAPRCATQAAPLARGEDACPMIDFARATRAEIETVQNALTHYERILKNQVLKSDNHAVRGNAQYRAHLVESIRSQVNER